jgi:hypothetical protein
MLATCRAVVCLVFSETGTMVVSAVRRMAPRGESRLPRLLRALLAPSTAADSTFRRASSPTTPRSFHLCAGRTYSRKDVDLPGYWVVRCSRADVEHPAGWRRTRLGARRRAAFTTPKPLGTRNDVITELHSYRLTRSLTYASTPSLPSTPQGSLPTCWLSFGRAGLSPAGRRTEFHDDYRIFNPFRPALPGRTGGNRPQLRVLLTRSV